MFPHENYHLCHQLTLADLFHDHHWFSAIRQVHHGIRTQASPSAVLLFIERYDPGHESSIIPYLGLLVDLFHSSFPSVVNVNRPSFLSLGLSFNYNWRKVVGLLRLIIINFNTIQYNTIKHLLVTGAIENSLEWNSKPKEAPVNRRSFSSFCSMFVINLVRR